MTWARLDDSFDGHPKVVRAGNAAAGLFARFIAYSNRVLSDGNIASSIAVSYGTKPQLEKLLKVGLLHRAGHGCPRCGQPEEGDFQVHDFLQWNRSRAKVMADREREAHKKANQRAANAAAGSDAPRIDDESNANRSVFEDESMTNRSGSIRENAGRRDVSPGDSSPHARNSPSHPAVLPTEVQQASKPARSTASVSEAARACTPLIDAMNEFGMRVRWNLSEDQWVAIRDGIDRFGVEALVQAARRAWGYARATPHSAAYFLGAWDDLDRTPALPGIGSATPTDASLSSAALALYAGTNVVPIQGRRLSATDRSIAEADAAGERAKLLIYGSPS